MNQICDICGMQLATVNIKWSCTLFSVDCSGIFWEMYVCPRCDRQMVFRIQDGEYVLISTVADGRHGVVNMLSGTVNNCPNFV